MTYAELVNRVLWELRIEDADKVREAIRRVKGWPKYRRVKGKKVINRLMNRQFSEEDFWAILEETQKHCGVSVSHVANRGFCV